MVKGIIVEEEKVRISKICHMKDEDWPSQVKHLSYIIGCENVLLQMFIVLHLIYKNNNNVTSLRKQ